MDWYALPVFLAACLAASATGALFPTGAWYRGLSKPSWTPPDWLFPVAWMVLYLLMALAAARVAALPDAGLALAFWALQIALNTLWTPVFFGLHRMRAGLVIILGLWAAVVATTLSFFALDAVAGWMLVPYVIWVSYAAALNASFVARNPAVPAAG